MAETEDKAAKKHFLAEAEEEMLALWDKEKTFEESVEQRKGRQRFSFYDGPPYANGLPHHGHAVQSILKDSVTRYKTMRGYYVPRRVGWDTHGLPIEYKIEQELGFTNKADILKYGIDKFNQACRDSVFTYVKEWEQFYKRIGRWADTEHAYATLENSYIESVWWTFAQIYKKGMVYEDLRSTPYCPRCATPLSNFELNQGYQDGVKDPSLYVKFPLAGDERKLIAWTTTPWTLPANAALAVHPGEVYVTVKVKDDAGKEERLILAQKRLAILDEPYEIEAEMSGQELVGKSYEPLFHLDGNDYDLKSKNLYKVWGADFVGIEEGSGVLHMAPAFGEDDLEFGKSQGIPVLQTVDGNGHVKTGIGLKAAEGAFFKNADQPIIKHLSKERKVFSVETIEHTYPFCWRCDTPLLYYAITSWFIKVSEVRDRLVANNQQIEWVPEHIKGGRFGKWLEGARDWGFSRNRFWGAPLPIWKTEDGEVVVVESIEQLKKSAVNPETIDDLHRPFIDDVILRTKDGKQARRVEEVFDVWFESGSMPYAQDHYPFENKELFEANYPADFISEGQDQTRGWFYTLHAIATILFDKPAFKNVVTTGWINAADGRKLSKRLKNYTPLDSLFAMFGADSLRYYMMTSPIVHGEDINFSNEWLVDVQRNVFMTLQNTFNFYKTYAGVDNWKPPKTLQIPQSDNVLDRWIVNRLHKTVVEVTKNADAYQIDRATKPIRQLLDDVSNWYVRRSRRRFWKSENDNDKNAAYETLWYVLLRTTQLLAPWAPFMSDRIYRQLATGTDLPRSVHLTDWPEIESFNERILEEMALTRHVIAEALAQRSEAGIKVRQPLASLRVVTKVPLDARYHYIIADEVNVKKVDSTTGAGEAVELNTTLTPELEREGMARDVVRLVQEARKKAGLNVDNRITLSLNTSDVGLRKALDEHSAMIRHETLAISLAADKDYGYKTEATVGAATLAISLEKAA